MEPKICPKCNEPIDLSNSRLFTEVCGHIKCRKCIIKEENGCDICKLNNFNTDMYESRINKNSVLEYENEENNLTLNQRNDFNKTDVRQNGEQCKTRKRKTQSIPSYITKIKEEAGTFYKCNVCNKKFKSRTQQYYHIYCQNASIKPFKCNKCTKAFVSSSHLKYHIEGHSKDKKYKCDICGKVFSIGAILKQHKKSHQQNQKKTYDTTSIIKNSKSRTFKYRRENISCEVCEKTFSRKSNLKQHLLTHSGIKKFNCNKCHKSFGRKSSYNEHVKHHLKVKEYTCLDCSKILTSKKALLRHEKGHKDLSLYSCPYCSIKSKRRDNLTRHIKNMHSTEDIGKAVIDLKKSPKNVLEKADNAKQQLSLTNSLNDQNEKLLVEEEHNSIENEKYIKNSVIRSIGNVQPVFIKNCEISNSLENNTKVIQPSDNITVNCEKATKPKKVYDPCEIYRKILLATEDDITEAETLFDDPKESHLNCCNQITQVNKAGTKNDQSTNFTEMHWRKRTFQSFFAAL